MNPEAVIGHATGGRVRVKIPGMRGDAAFFQEMGQALLELPGVRTVTCNHRTASILITGPAASPDRLRELGAEHGLFTLREQRKPESGRHGRSSGDERVAAVLLALAVLQTLRGQIMVPALSLIWYALEMIRWNAPEGVDQG